MKMAAMLRFPAHRSLGSRGVIKNKFDYLTIKADGAFPDLPVIWWLIYVIHKTITHANARSNCRIYMIQKMRSAKSRLEHRAFSDSDSVSPAF